MVESQANQIYLIVAVAIVAMLVMAGAIIIFVVFYQKRMIQEQMKRQAMEYDFQQKMLQAELESQETERRRLAGDLHDSIGGMLSTIRVGISTIARQVTDAQGVESMKQMLDDTITSVRRISRDLMPSTLERFGLIHALTELCERFQETSRIAISFESKGEFKSFDKNRELMIFRIVQELLNNAVKHSKATQISVTLWPDPAMKILVQDDGIGFDADQVRAQSNGTRGLGLLNIENRARLLGGTIEYPKASGKGSTAILTIPVKDEQKT